MSEQSRRHDFDAESSPQGRESSGRRVQRRKLKDWQDLVTQQLEEAAERGAFDNLPGKGRPLPLDTNPNEPADMHMANKLLKDNNLSPSWIGDRKELTAEIEKLRADIQREWTLRRARAGEGNADKEALERTWQRQVREWDARVIDLNRRIVSLNISLPVWRMELHRLRLDEELKRIGALKRDSERPS